MEQEITTELKLSQKPIVRWTLMTAGTILVGIGILGMFLPLLPTTVFFLMAAWCYARSSEKFYFWLHHNRFFGKYLKNYRSGKGISFLSKIFTIALLWITILYSMFYSVENFYVRIILLAVAIGVTIHIIVIPTRRSEK